MSSKLLKIASFEAQNRFELSLRRAFEVLEPKLRPPFQLTILKPQEYSQLNKAIVYGVLTQPHLAKIHIKHLHSIVIDGYGFFLTLLIKVVNELYVKLVDSAKNQLVWITKEMIDVVGVGFDGLLVCLLRQVVGGDFSEGNLWLCFELVSIFLYKWDYLLEEQPLVLISALYTFLRLLADHCRSLSNVKLDALKTLETEFCVRMLRQQFHLCLKLGRDLIRLLQDLVHVPEFRAIWKNLVLNPSEFRTPEFLGISQLYCSRTSSRYFLLRITPEMETQLRFLLTHVKFRSQKRYQAWFAKKFLLWPERETLIVDIVRFICCAHHPSNEIIQSDVIPRWAVIGWLLKSCRKNYVEAKVKLAMFYDWLFFDERMDNIMNIEPAMLLMVCSIPKYIDMTHTLLEFLFLLIENYDVNHTDVIVRGVSSAFKVLVQKGVVRSMNILTSCVSLSPFLKDKLKRFLSGHYLGAPKELQTGLPPISVPPLSLPNISCLGTPTPSPKGQSTCSTEDASFPISDERFLSGSKHPRLSVPPLSLPNMSCLGTPTPSPKGQSTCSTEDASFPISDERFLSGSKHPRLSVPPLSLPNISCLGTPTPSPKGQSTCSTEDASFPISDERLLSGSKHPRLSVPTLSLPNVSCLETPTPSPKATEDASLPISDDTFLSGSKRPRLSVQSLCLPNVPCLETTTPFPKEQGQPACTTDTRPVDSSVLISGDSISTCSPSVISCEPKATEDASLPISDDRFLSGSKCPHLSVQSLCLPDVPCLETTTPFPKGQGQSECTTDTGPVDSSILNSGDSISTCSPSVISCESEVDFLKSLLQSLGETIKKSNTMGLRSLETILLSFVNLDNHRPASGLACPEVLSSKIEKALELNGYKLFSPLKSVLDAPDCDDETGSATALITRTFIFSQHERMKEMLLFWSKNGLPVGARLLSYASRLSYEAYVAGNMRNAMIENNTSKVNDSGMPLLIFHADGYYSFLNGRIKDSHEDIVSASKMDKKLVAKLVDSAFAAYRCFLMHSRTILHREVDTSLSKLLFSDLMSCSHWERKSLNRKFFCSIFCHLSDISIGDEDIIRLLVSQLDHADLVNMQFDIGLKKYSMFGDKTETIFHIIKHSLNWDCLEQHKLWGLIRSELAVSTLQVDKIILKFISSDYLDASFSAIAVGGLLTLCSCCAPTPELVGAIMFLPNNAFKDLAAAALATWVVSNSPMLFDSLAKFSEKLDNKNGDSIFSNSAGIMINHSATLWLLNYFNAQGMNGSDILSNFPINILEK